MVILPSILLSCLVSGVVRKCYALNGFIMEITDLLFRSFSRSHEESAIRPQDVTFISKVEQLATDHHFDKDPNIRNSIMYFYLGMINMLFKTETCKRNKVTHGIVSVYFQRIVFVTLHRNRQEKWIEIYIFHLTNNFYCGPSMSRQIYMQILEFANKCGYSVRKVGNALKHVRHVTWKIEETGKLKFAGTFVKTNLIFDEYMLSIHEHYKAYEFAGDYKSEMLNFVRSIIFLTRFF